MKAPIVTVVRHTIAPLTRTRLFRAWAPKLMPPVEFVIAKVSGNQVQLSGLLVPSLVLHCTGAKTGLVRDVPLMYTPDGNGRAIIAGTNFAGGRHPGWTVNLAAHPTAQITVRGRVLEVQASRIPESGRDAAWARIEAQWPGYRSYERESGREVRLFLLQPTRVLQERDA
ncbi:nitroreductase family deazaflavin-dependent oxidoreductase [Microbacterium sp. YY-03]|uniref:nitroreductase family deazaflavin-dependent oxidoreductase n=1 Tax=Microbacterium sp. YY-03 TaxID=3421636 RepID=UPI003D1739A0